MEQRQGTLRGEHFFEDGMPIYVNRAEETFEMDYHAHDFIEITYVSIGTGFHHLGGRVQAVSKGDLFLLPIGTPHVFRPVSASRTRGLTVYNCIFPDTTLRAAAAAAPDMQLLRILGLDDGQRGEAISLHDGGYALEPIFETMFEEYARRQKGASAVLFGLLVRLLVLLARKISGPEEQAFIGTSDAIAHAADYIRRHPADQLTISHMAGLCRMSERHFFRLFKQRTGHTFHEFVQHARIQAGCDLLLGTKAKIAAIAETVGYKDIPSFNRVFRRITGMTPGAYRRRGGHS